MAQIIVSHGLCSAIRPKVLTALEPYGFKGLQVEAWGQGRHGQPLTEHMTFPDEDAWVQKHIARITVSDQAAKWAEWLLWQSGHMYLESRPINPKLNWSIPLDCKAQSSLGRGTMPTPWSQQPRPISRRSHSRPQRPPLLAWLGSLFSSSSTRRTPRSRRQARRR
jgi:hypothetical protein